MNHRKGNGKKKKNGSFNDLFADADIFDNIAGSVSHFSPKITRVKSSSEDLKYCKYISPPEELHLSKIRDVAIIELKELGNVLNSICVNLSEFKFNALEALDSISKFIKDNSDIEPDYLRKIFFRDIAIKNEIVSYASLEYNKTRISIGEISKFLVYLGDVDPKEHILVQDFIENEIYIETSDKRMDKIASLKEPVVFPSLECAPKRDIFHMPTTPQNKVLNKMKRMFKKLEATDSTFIIESLAKTYTNHHEVEEIFFEEAWTVQPYPWSHPLICFPDMSAVVPKVFNPVYLPNEFALLSFEELSLLQWWPLKDVVNKLELMIFEINPFNICRTIWDIIEGIGSAVRSLAPDSMKDEPLDFDQLFSYLIIVIFATLSPSITYALSYAASYREAIDDDPQMMYAMGHLEGLTAYFANLDYTELKHKSAQIVKENIKEDKCDPLGITDFSE